MATETNLEKELFDLEKQFWQAMKDRDVATASRLTDFPCIVAGAQGAGPIDEQTFTAMMKDPRYTLESFELERDAKVRVVRDDIAIIAYKAHEELTVEGQRVELDVAESSTWVRREGRWLCAQHSEAVVGDPFGRDRTAAAPQKKEAEKARVGSTTFTTPSDRELVATRLFDAPRELIWQISTSSEHIPRWLRGPEGWTMIACEIDLRPGGPWRWVWRQPDGSEMEMRGEYREIAPPERVVNTESWGGDWAETLTSLVLTEEDGRTKMVSTVLYPSKEEREKAIGAGLKEGWSASYDRLDEYLRTMAG